MMIALKRYLQLLLAYAVTVAISALGATSAIFISGEGDGSFLPFLPFTALAAIIIALYLSLPTIFIVAAAEHWQLRQPWIYVAVAVLGGLVLSVALRLPWWLPLVAVALGLAAGLIFWAVAGRSAGILKAEASPLPQRILMALLALSALATGAALTGAIAS